MALFDIAKILNSVKPRLENLPKNIYSCVKKNFNVISIIISLIISSITLYYVIITHKSPAEIHCELEMIQRPDSVFQAQIYIWNSGEEPAENITFQSNKKNVFIADTAGNKRIKLSMFVFPALSVNSTLTPSRILNHLGKEVKFNKYKFIIPKMPECEREDNYFIVMINYRDKQKLINRKHSIYLPKFCELKKYKKYNSFIEEIMDNIDIYYGGQFLKPDLVDVKYLSNIDTSRYYFPSLKEVSDYPKKATAPDYLLPPLKILVVLRSQHDYDNSGFRGYKKFRGFKGW